MTQYNNLNVKCLIVYWQMSNLQLNTLKSVIKYYTVTTLNPQLNVIDDSTNESNFLCKLLLTDRHILKFCKAFANNLSDNIKW